MASPEKSPPSKSVIRRRLLAATPEAPKPSAANDLSADSVDFNNGSEDSAILQELQRIGRPAAQSDDVGEVDALLRRYEAEKGVSDSSLARRPGMNGARVFPPDPQRGDSGRLRASGGLPPLTTAGNVELERLRAENAELKDMVAEYRDHIESNQLHDWEQKIQEAEQLLTDKDALIESLQKQVLEWEEKLKTHRFVPSDDDLAQMADELDKERSQFAQERKQLDQERKQLKEDEESLMKQMREMEVGMAKDRAELARQRTELHRMQVEVRHELDLLQRGDATMKDRMAQFQRRTPDAAARPGSAVPQQAASFVPEGPGASPAPQQEARPRESGVFRRLFGQNG